MNQSIIGSKNATRVKGIKYVGTLANGEVWAFEASSGNMIPASAGGGGDTIFTGGTMTSPSTITMGGNGLTFSGGQVTVKGSGTGTTLNTALVDSASNPLFYLYNNGRAEFTGKLGIGITNPSAKLEVKGTDTSSATQNTNLTNSAGSKLFLVYNNGRTEVAGNLGIGVANPQAKLDVKGTGTGVTLNTSLVDSAGSPLFYLYNNGRTEFTGKVSVGGTNPSAKLEVKGAGATAGTTALLVENSAGTDLFEIKDDGTIIGNLPNLYTQDGTLTAARTVTMGGNGLTFDGGTTTIKGAGTAFGINLLLEDSTGADLLTVYDEGTVHIAGKVGLGFGNPSAKLHVRGTSTGSAANLLLEDSTGSDLLLVYDDGVMLSKGNLGVGFTSGTNPVAKVHVRSELNGYNLWCENSSQVQLLRLHDDGNLWLNGNTGIGFGLSGVPSQAATARLQVRGVDQLAGTKGFMVEDSTMASLFEIRNDGSLGMNGNTPVAQGTTGGGSAIISAGVGAASKQDDTYGGYTIAQVVQHFINRGDLA